MNPKLGDRLVILYGTGKNSIFAEYPQLPPHSEKELPVMFTIKLFLI